MTLSIEELKHLEQLSCITLNENEQEKFLSQLDNIINFLGQLKDIDVENIDTNFEIENSLRTHKWVSKFENTKWIINNIKHEIVNNSIVIKSVLND